MKALPANSLRHWGQALHVLSTLLLCSCTARTPIVSHDACSTADSCGPNCQACIGPTPVCAGEAEGCVCTARSCTFGSWCDAGACAAYGKNTEIMPELAPSFGSGGHLVVDVKNTDNANQYALGPMSVDGSGRLLLTGSTAGPTHMLVFVARYHAEDATPDLSYGTDGISIIDLGSDASGQQVVADQEGNAIVAVSRPAGTPRGVIRLLESGDLDPAFGVAGIGLAPRGAEFACDALSIRPSDGYLFISAQGFGAGHANLTATVFRPDGTLATSYGDGGTVYSTYTSDEFGAALLFVEDGGFILGGQAYRGGADGFDFSIRKFTGLGDVDTDFAQDGGFLLSFGESRDVVRALLELPDGRVVAAGTAGTSATGADFAMIAFDAGGTIDISFAASDMYPYDRDGGEDAIVALKLFDDRHFIALGHRTIRGDTDLTLALFDFDGALDASFGTDGFFDIDLGSTEDRALAMLVTADHALLIAGRTSNGADTDIGVVKLRLSRR